MNWDAIGAIGEIVGAVAVFASLFYVGLQVRQNSKAVRGQTFESLSTTLADLAMQTANDPEMTDILVKAIAGEELTAHEDTRFVALLRANMRVASAVYYQYSLDLLEIAQMKDLTFSASALLGTPTGKRLWEVSKAHLAQEFVSYMDETLKVSQVDKVAAIYGQDPGGNA